MGHESGQGCLTVFIPVAEHFQHFKIQGHFSVRKKVVFYLETQLFLPIIGDNSPKSDWN